MRLALFHTDCAWALSLVRALLDDGLDEVGLFAAADPDGPNLELAEQAARVGAPSWVVDDARSEACTRTLAAFSPDLILVATFPQKLPERVLGTASLAAVNVHPSLLPRYRGAHPEFWVIRTGEAETGVTLHLMAERMDAGEIIARARARLADDETLGSLSDKLGLLATDLVRPFLERCRRRAPIESAPQDEALASRAPRVRAEDLRIRWDMPAVEIVRLVRASYPFLEATATLGDRRVLVRRCALGSSALALGQCVTHAATGLVEVGTRAGSVVLQELEPDPGCAP